MSTDFPTALDALTNPLSTDNTVTVPHASQHSNENDAIEALEAKVGANGSAVQTSHDYKLSGVTSADKAASLAGTEDLTNKSLKSGTKITLGSDATGDIYYRHSDGTLKRLAADEGKILKIASGIPTYAAETVTNDASTTVEGIVEEATLAEIDANTGAGGTSARLFVNPSTLGKSIDGTLASNSDAKIPSQKAVKTYVDNVSTAQVVTASANLKISNDTARTNTTGTYAKLKESTVFYGGTVRVVFDLKTGNGAETVNGRIYVNGVAIGTERSKTGDTNYTTQATEDISVNPFDKVQIYGHGSGLIATYVQNFRISYDLSTGNTYYINPSL
jgi:hypothetical protein